MNKHNDPLAMDFLTYIVCLSLELKYNGRCTVVREHRFGYK